MDMNSKTPLGHESEETYDEEEVQQVLDSLEAAEPSEVPGNADPADSALSIDETGGIDDADAADAGSTIAFSTGVQDIEDPLDVPEGWEEETVAVQVGSGADGFSEDTPAPVEEDATEKPMNEENVMPPMRRRNPFKRVPHRVYHRGRIPAFVYVLTTIALCVFASVMFLRVFNDVLAFITENKAIVVTIDEEDTTDDVAEKFRDAGLIKYDWLFSYVAKFEGAVGPYEAGDHTLNDNMNYMQLLDAIEQKEAVRETVDITFIEGLTVDEVADLLEENNVCTAEDFKKVASGDAVYGFDFESGMSGSSAIFYPLEGYLFPDTYQFYTNSEPADVIYKMLQNFQNKIDTVDTLMDEMGLNLHQTVTLASIIRAEASGDPDNMRLVSSVYWNRLNDTDNYPMLQSDPTRDYANSVILMAGNGASNQRKASLYNTYECTGLPAGPICSPGMDAIMAALQPESTAYYYFCSNTRTGEFYYAETLQGHEENIEQID